MNNIDTTIIEKNKKSNRIYSIDVAKAICIMLVVIHHYKPDEIPLWYETIDTIIQPIRMPMFMFASGFLFQLTRKKDNSYIEAVLKRSKRLLIPYFTTSIIVISLKLFTQSTGSGDIDNPVSLASFIHMLYLPEAAYYLWFIWSILLMYIIVLPIRNKALLSLLFIISLILPYISYEPTRYFAIYETKRYFIYFITGIIFAIIKNHIENNNLYIAQKWELIKINITKLPYLICICIFFTLISIMHIYNGNDNFEMKVFILPALGIISLIMISWYITDHFNHCKNLLLKISETTFTIYLFHTTFEGFAKSIIRKIPYLVDANNDIGFLCGLILVSASGIVMPIVLHKFLLAKFELTKKLFAIK